MWKNDSEKLYYAIIGRNIQGVKEALENKEIDLENLSIPREYSRYGLDETRALALAINSETEGNVIKKMLIEAGADVNSEKEYEGTYLLQPLHTRETIEMLLEAGADPNVKDDITDNTVIDEYISSYGVSKGTWEIVHLIEKYGGKITKNTLQQYIEREDCYDGKELVQYLQDNGEETGLPKDLEYAVCGENKKLLEYLETHEVSDEEKILCQAAAHCNVLVLQKLKEKGCDFRIDYEEDEDFECDKIATNLVHIAAQYNTSEVVTYLINEDMDLNVVRVLDGNNALTLAAIAGNRDNVKVLKSAGEDWIRRDEMHSGSWGNVCQMGGKESIKILLENGFYPTDTEIVYGYSQCNEDTLEALLEYNIPYDKEPRGKEGELLRTGFEELCAENADLAYKLYKKIDNITITLKLLQCILLGGNEKFIKEVIKDNKNLSADCLTEALAWAVSGGRFEMVKELVQRGADINGKVYLHCTDVFVHTPMYVAVHSTSNDILEYLIEQGGDVSILK